MIRHRFCILASVALLAAGLAVGGPARAVAVYGAVGSSDETGDVSGLQVLVIGAGRAPTVKVLFCEGGCTCWETGRLRRLGGDAIAFEVVDRTTTDDGRVVRNALRFHGQLSARMMTIRGAGPDFEWPLDHLPRQARRWDDRRPLPDCPI